MTVTALALLELITTELEALLVAKELEAILELIPLALEGMALGLETATG